MRLPSIQHFMNIQNLPSPVSSRNSSLSSSRCSLSSVSDSYERISPIPTPPIQPMLIDQQSYTYQPYRHQIGQEQPLQLPHFKLPVVNSQHYYPLTPSPPPQHHSEAFLSSNFNFQYVPHQQQPPLHHPIQARYTKPQSLPSPKSETSYTEYSNLPESLRLELDHNDLSHITPTEKPIKRRTRTGCITCRKRRIKCDERKPFCNNCAKSKIYCHGYVNKPTKTELKMMARMKKQGELQIKQLHKTSKPGCC